MTPERAQEIVTAINARAWMTMGLADQAGSLAAVTLSQMIEASQIIRSGNRAAREAAVTTGEGHAISVVPDDRLIAAVYVLEHYQPDSEPILSLPHQGIEGNRKVLAVIAMDDEELAGDEDGR